MNLNRTPLHLALSLCTLLTLNSCGGSGTAGGRAQSSGNFLLESTNLKEGAVWQINRLIELKFNNAVDMDTVHFGTIMFQSEQAAYPVTGSFEVDENDDSLVYFRPTCPTSAGNSNGGFLPGGVEYTMTLPAHQRYGATVIRDQFGRPLNKGVVRTFVTPNTTGGSLFVDYVDGPPALRSGVGVEWPSGLNFMHDQSAVIRFHFNQAIDARPGNLNNDFLHVLFAEGEMGSPDENNYPDENRLPGQLVLERNCAKDGAVVALEIAGILPPNRKLQAVIKRSFTDISGQSNRADLLPRPHQTPTLAEALQWSQTDWSKTAVADEAQEFFHQTIGLDLSDPLPLPLADIERGYVQAGLGFPGDFTTKDFVWADGDLEIRTTSTAFVTDSNNVVHTLRNGVLNCRNFHVAANSVIRGVGNNPLVIYASGDVGLDGVIDVSGHHAVWPTGLGSPRRAEGGAFGECGGGRGGTSSQETSRETWRGSTGEGAWGFAGGGGQGGEGGINQEQYVHNLNNTKELACNTSAGGGGGTFSLTENVAIYWPRWEESDRMPAIDRNFDMDHNLSWNSATDPRLPGTRFAYTVRGGEAGVRGSSWGNGETDAARPHGVYGMEDLETDLIWDPITGESYDGHKEPNGGPLHVRFSQAWNDPVNQPNPFSNDVNGGQTLAVDGVNTYPRMLGHPTRGADGGLAGPSIFSNDGTVANDFWGVRVNNDGSITKGELLTPWAGSGGGASGDMVLYERGDDGDAPLVDSFPDPAFPNGTITVYRKGAPGGGGGGQIMLLALGDIVIGSAAQVLAKGGNGIGGESLGWTRRQVSGSGGGSGGHIIIGTASKLDLSAVDITDGSQGGDRDWTIQNSDYYELPVTGYFSEVFLAVGGRRGWAMSEINRTDLDGDGQTEWDGNDTYAPGRGGAGGNGVVQIHVSNPAQDILWPPAVNEEIKNYLHHGNVDANPADVDRVEEILRIFAAPKPYALAPTFAAQSMIRSKWIDTGLAEIRQPATASGIDYPNYADPVIGLRGIDPTTGLVETDAGMVRDLLEVCSGAAKNAQFFDYEVRLPNASQLLAQQVHLLYQPRLLHGFVFLPDRNRSQGRTIVGASYRQDTDTLTLLTDPNDGVVVQGVGANWALQPHFFRISTAGLMNSLPEETSLRIQFQGAEQTAPGSNEPGEPFPAASLWTSDLSLLEGYRFIRYQITFNLDAQNQGLDLATPRPTLHNFKLPVCW